MVVVVDFASRYLHHFDYDYLPTASTLHAVVPASTNGPSLATFAPNCAQFLLFAKLPQLPVLLWLLCLLRFIQSTFVCVCIQACLYLFLTLSTNYNLLTELPWLKI